MVDETQGSSSQVSKQQVSNWLNSASPDDVIAHGKQALQRIGKLDQTYRDRFATEARADPTVARLFEMEPTG